MARRYDSFVLRCWRVGGERRVEVEHLQSGGRTRVATLAAATDWIGTRCDGPNDQGVATRSADASKEVRAGEGSSGDAERRDGAATDAQPRW